MSGEAPTLRDWFAGRAMACFPVSSAASDDTIRAAAETAYRIADAMMTARNRPETPEALTRRAMEMRALEGSAEP